MATSSRERLSAGWQACATAPGHIVSPDALAAAHGLVWHAMSAPMPAAAALRESGAWRLDDPPRRFDAEDWWYRAEFNHDGAGPVRLGFDGLAGVADAWLNGVPLLQGLNNMFVGTVHDVASHLRPGVNTLVLRFAALDTWLAQRRPRPRWRVPMLEQQQLRWTRNTLLGRTPGWSPPAAAVGPWRDVWIERGPALRLVSTDLKVEVDAAGTGRVTIACTLDGLPPGATVSLELTRGDAAHRVHLASASAAGAFDGVLRIDGVERWWPHTHGEPALYDARLDVAAEGAAPQVLPLRRIGFRTVEADTADGGFKLRVNGERVFCRGACWTPLDPVTLHAPPEACAGAVAQVREAGMNMLRVSGTMVYESPAFFDACDAQGVLVWQDFMFANMDYPGDDPAFVETVREEARQQLAAWQGRPSLAVLCGNSEVEQQAAMWGAPRTLWSPALFHEVLAACAHDAMPDVPYWPSSAHGGAFPHQPSAGTTSYYGVGAYLRPLTDARHAAPRFATECLAFANVPEASTLLRLPGGAGAKAHHPAWKARVPRDLGAGWDFDDVRDHYLATLFGVDVPRCRSTDHERYLALGRVVSGEVMRASFDEWRRPGSTCGGALVLMLRDLWAGAGWGLLDDTGEPKAAFHLLRRALQPVSVSITDEGNNGLVAHLINEGPAPLRATLRGRLFGPGDVPVGDFSRDVDLPARSASSIALAGEFEHFFDLSYAFRFGPPPVTLVHLALAAADGTLQREAFFLPEGPGPGPATPLGLEAHIEGDVLVLTTQRFAHSVVIELDGHAPDDNHFHLAPGDTRRVRLRRLPSYRPDRPARGTVDALNGDRSVLLLAPPRASLPASPQASP